MEHPFCRRDTALLACTPDCRRKPVSAGYRLGTEAVDAIDQVPASAALRSAEQDTSNGWTLIGDELSSSQSGEESCHIRRFLRRKLSFRDQRFCVATLVLGSASVVILNLRR